jgi:uncharacterized repeat protein (TIGR01451 family)
VIASSQPRQQPAVLPAEARLPLPDDGLRLPAQPAAPTATARPLLPPPVPDPGVRQAVHVPDHRAAPGRPQDGVVPATAPTAPDPEPRDSGANVLSVRVVGPAVIQQGETLRCQIVVRNNGAVVLAGVRVELPLPAGMRVLATEPPASQVGDRPGWNLGNLPAGSEQRLRIDLHPAGTEEIDLRPVAGFTAAVGMRTGIVVPAFGLQAAAPGLATPGEKVVFRLQLSNRTAQPIRRVALHCELGDGLSHPQGQTLEADLPGELGPGQVRSLELEAQASKAGPVTATFEARAEGGLTAKARADVRVSEPALTLALHGPRQANTGQPLDFRLEVANPGRSPTGVLRLLQVLPDGLEFVSASPGGLYNPSTQTITWAMDGLSPGDRRDVAFRVRPRRMGDWALHASAGVEGAREVRATHAVGVGATPVLAVELAAHDDPIAAGQTTTYEVRVYNQGPVPADNVRLRLAVPDNLLAFQADGPTRWSLSGQNVLFEPIARMPTRTDTVYRIRVRGASAGSGRVRVELTGDGLGQAITQELTSHVRQTGATPIAGR